MSCNFSWVILCDSLVCNLYWPLTKLYIEDRVYAKIISKEWSIIINTNTIIIIIIITLYNYLYSKQWKKSTTIGMASTYNNSTVNANHNTNEKHFKSA